jgi:hypothetical protein
MRNKENDMTKTIKRGGTGNWRKVRDILSPSVGLLIFDAAIFPLGVLLTLTYCLLMRIKTMSEGYVILSILMFIYCASVIVALVLVIFGLFQSFRGGKREHQLTTIVVTYFSVILAFSSIYYGLIIFGDNRDALSKYKYYHSKVSSLVDISNVSIPMLADQRAFSGIDQRLWSGVDWITKDGTNPGLFEPQDAQIRLRDILDNAKCNSFSGICHFMPVALPSVIIDCIHFSVSTITTLGYGDITPKSWYAKLFCNIEVLCGISLLGGALSLLFSGWHSAGSSRVP